MRNGNELRVYYLVVKIRRGNRQRQPTVLECGCVDPAERGSLAGFAGALWQLEQYLASFPALGLLKNGVWEEVFKKVRLEPDLKEIMIDSTAVRVHQHAAGAIKKPWSGW